MPHRAITKVLVLVLLVVVVAAGSAAVYLFNQKTNAPASGTSSSGSCSMCVNYFVISFVEGHIEGSTIYVTILNQGNETVRSFSMVGAGPGALVGACAPAPCSSIFSVGNPTSTLGACVPGTGYTCSGLNFNSVSLQPGQQIVLVASFSSATPIEFIVTWFSGDTQTGKQNSIIGQVK